MSATYRPIWGHVSLFLVGVYFLPRCEKPILSVCILSESRPVRIMSLISYRYYPKTTWNTFWNSAWPSMIQLQSYITFSSRINKVGKQKMVFFVFFIEFDLIWPWYVFGMTFANHLSIVELQPVFPFHTVICKFVAIQGIVPHYYIWSLLAFNFSSGEGGIE